MRVALLSYRSKPHCGGQGIYIRRLSRELVALGHTVEVFSGQPYPELDDGVVPEGVDRSGQSGERFGERALFDGDPGQRVAGELGGTREPFLEIRDGRVGAMREVDVGEGHRASIGNTGRNSRARARVTNTCTSAISRSGAGVSPGERRSRDDAAGRNSRARARETNTNTSAISRSGACVSPGPRRPRESARVRAKCSCSVVARSVRR